MQVRIMQAVMQLVSQHLPAPEGAFIPGSVVDFQKGECQLNIDYALCEALKNMGLNGLNDIMTIYDVMCQYHVNLWDRIANNPNLSISEKANLIWVLVYFMSTVIRMSASFGWQPHLFWELEW